MLLADRPAGHYHGGMSQIPPPPPYPTRAYTPPAPIDRTAEHVRLLGILTWVFAGIQAFFGLFTVIYIIMGVVFLVAPPQSSSQGHVQVQPHGYSQGPSQGPNQGPSSHTWSSSSTPPSHQPPTYSSGYTSPSHNQAQPPEFVGWMFIAIGSFSFIFIEGIALITAIAAHSLLKRRRRMLCLIAAGIACLSMPLGTVLGVFTIIVLVRPEAKTLFGETPSPGSPSPTESPTGTDAGNVSQA